MYRQDKHKLKKILANHISDKGLNQEYLKISQSSITRKQL